MKLPSVAGNLIPAPGSCYQQPPYQQPQFGQYPASRHPDKERHDYHGQPAQPPPEDTAFKPFYKK